MKKKKKLLYFCCNICILLLSLISLIYSILSVTLSLNGAKSIYIIANKDYENCFGEKYTHEDSYFTDITCMKMEIATDTITKAAEYKEQYFDDSSHVDSYTILSNGLSEIQAYNKAIDYKDSIFPLPDSCNVLYSSLNYMIYGSNALLIDIINFTDNQDLLSLAADKDIQEIHLMAKMSSALAINLNKQIDFHKYIILMNFLVIIGTLVNMYRLKKRKKRIRNKSI